MVLLIAVAGGLVAGFLRAKYHQQQFQNVKIKYLALVFLAYLPQFLAFTLTATRTRIPNTWIPFILIGSQTVLLVFAWVNRHLKGFTFMGLGLLANFMAILLNGGFMPINPEVINRVLPAQAAANFNLGERVAFSKDMLLLREQTRLWFLGDIFTLPTWTGYAVAFSFGDILISMGAFWFFWELGRPQNSISGVSP